MGLFKRKRVKQPERADPGTDTDRRRREREKREIANFWAYDGTPQPEIDESLL